MMVNQPSLLLWTSALLAAAAVCLLRFSWGRALRSAPLNAAAWGLLAFALTMGMAGGGAWGVAMVTLAALAMAFCCLALAAATAPPGKTGASNRRAHMLPEGQEPLRIGGRMVSFLLSVPGAMLVALILGLAARGTARALGAHEADGNVLMLFLMPLLWAVMAMLILLWPQRRRQVGLLTAPALLGLAMLWMVRP
ncbi:hypothetical protein [Sphingobium fuliginis]|jgi:hypothetical protein|uniref:Uncharacterized protein n=1 Tax=Sphingobium fuliginis (strain ATCC 27551) TaxID=336203 RepID=A0A292Z592_SPHSA|nr:hypothetical protein [Sphingobium fuliginis]GAY20842.1 hypothetical protein SFOMI_1372 [Sphingobium fuliginis]